MSKNKPAVYTYELVITGARLNAQQRQWLADSALGMVNPGGAAEIKCEMRPNPKVTQETKETKG